MAHCGMPRIARRLGSVCQDKGRPRSDQADHGVCRTMAQRCSAPAPVVEGVSHQSARKKGLFPAPRRVNRRRHRPLPVSNLSFPYRWIPACPASQFFSLKNWHHPSHPFHYSQNFLLICSDTTAPFCAQRSQLPIPARFRHSYCLRSGISRRYAESHEGTGIRSTGLFGILLVSHFQQYAVDRAKKLGGCGGPCPLCRCLRRSVSPHIRFSMLRNNREGE
jgi:hypothetical protein